MSAEQTQIPATATPGSAATRRPVPTASPDHRSRSPGRTLGGYLLREMAFPTLFTLLGLTLLMLARQMLGFADLIVNRGLGGATVAQMAALQLVPLLSDTLPLSVLVGSLVALGRLAADQEIVALEACGLAARRLTRPVATFGVGATVVGLLLSAVLAPASVRRLDAMLEQIGRETPGAAIRAGEQQKFGSWRLQAREATPAGDRVRGVMIEVPDLGETIFAEHAALEPAGEGQTRIILRNGSFVSVSEDRPWLVRFAELDTLLPEEDEKVERPGDRTYDDLPYSALLEIAGDERDSEESRRDALTQIHGRLARPTAALVFGLLATPLFLARGGRSRASGGLLGIVALVVYYGLAQLATGLDHSGAFPAGLPLWLPNVALLALVWPLQRLVSGRSPVARSRAIGPGRLRQALARLRRRTRRTPGEAAAQSAPAVPARRERRMRTRAWALPRYVTGSFLRTLGIAFAVLLTAYLIVDVLERLKWFARYNATASEAIRFYGLRVPLLVSRIVPMSLLVATALLVSLTGARGELTAMRASGIPAPRGMLPVLGICAIVAPLSFLLSDQVVPRTNMLNELLKSAEIKVEEQWYRTPRSGRKAVWFVDGNRLVEAERLDPQLGIVQGLTIYDLDPRGLPMVRRDALGGRHLGGGTWRLFEPVRLDLRGTRLEPEAGAEFAALWEGVPVETDTRNLSVAEIRAEIAWADEHGYDSKGLQVDLTRKLAAPFSCLVLPAVVFLFALSGPPYPKTAAALVASVGVGIGSTLLNDLSASLGYGGMIPPGIAGWAPTAIFGILSAYLFVRLLRRA